MSQLAPYNGDGSVAYQAAPQAGTPQGHEVERFLRAFLKRWRLFAAVAGGFVALVTIATMLAPKSYTTTVRLLAGRSDSPATANDSGTTLPVLNALVLQSGVQSAETFAALAQQRDIAARVAQQLNLAASPQQLLARVSVAPVVNTALLNLNVSWDSPTQSANVANTFASAFVAQEREFVRAEAVAAIGFLSREMPSAAQKMHRTASRLARFQSNHGYIDATTHAQGVVARVTSIDQQIDQLTVDSSEAKALLDSVGGQLAGLSSTVDSAKEVERNPVSTDLRSKLADVETQLAEAEQKYTPAHPAVMALRQQRAALIAQISAQPSAVIGQTTVAPNPVYQSLQQQAATYRARIQGDEGQVRALKAQRQTFGHAVKHLPQEAVAFASIEEEAKRAANVYGALAQKYNDALVAESTAISDIVVVQPATADAAVKHPSLRTNLPIAIALGLLLGIAVIYLMGLLETRAYGRDFAALLGMPIVARIPSFDSKKQRLLPWINSMTAEAFLHLCVTLRLRNQRSMRTIAVLSSRRNEGKSTVAYRLAKSLATLQPGILLIDGDLRQPTLHEKAGCENAVGLIDVLKGSTPLSEAVQTIQPGLDVLPSRPETSNPVLMLQSRFEPILSEARSAYGTVIVDTPALSAVSDGLMIAAHVDGSLFVVAANETDDADARKSVAQLTLLGIDNVLGIVVNKDAVTVNDYGDYFATMNRALTAGPA